MPAANAARGNRCHRPAAQVLFASLLLAVGVSFSLASPSGAAGEQQVRLLVKFDGGVPAHVADQQLQRAGARSAGAIPQLGVRIVNVASGRATAASRSLRSSGRVEYVERETTFEPQDVMPSDPSFPTDFAIAGGAWGWTKTRTTQAWEITRGDASVVVAVLDTGLKTSGLSDFDGQVVTGWNVLKGSTDTSSSAGNHGTYVAGVVGLAVDNGVGNTGFCPGCRIMPVQIGSDSGATLSNMAKGITWAADHGARVINLSWAGTSSSSTLTNAVSYARAKGVVVVAAAGNSNCNCPRYPAATQGVLGVASTTPTDQKQGDSNYGSWVELAAPSGNVTAWPSINGAPGYAPAGGTSLAAPVVAAIAGLVASARPSLTVAEIEQALQTSAVPVVFSVKHGRVDALGALGAVGLSAADAGRAPTNSSRPSVFLQTNGDYNYAPLARAPQPGDVLIRGQGSWRGSAPLSLAGVRWERCSALGCATAGNAAKYTVQSTDAGYALRLAVTVENDLGSGTAWSALTELVGGVVLDPPFNTTPPTITGSAHEGETLAASSGSWTGSPKSYAYQWLRCDDTGAGCAPVVGATALSFVLGAADVGSTLRVSVAASNASGSTSAMSTATDVVDGTELAPAPGPSGTTTFTFSSALNKKNPLRSFSVTGGRGEWVATLTFSKCSTLGLTLRESDGTPLGSASGESGVHLRASGNGKSSYEVSGGQCSFTLTVTVPSS